MQWVRALQGQILMSPLGARPTTLPQTALFWLVNSKVLNIAAQSSSFLAELKFKCSSCLWKSWASCMRNGFESMSPPELMQYSPGHKQQREETKCNHVSCGLYNISASVLTADKRSMMWHTRTETRTGFTWLGGGSSFSKYGSMGWMQRSILLLMLAAVDQVLANTPY